ncbi:hypothetical protein [Smaragdicoccus niigatensis]|uniref:hypothetical protein n=1 Tax=Smaragdicoccus niigatensis TaxID=359359 RepID=UPI00036B8361|nr:hypothetical protein [Smaragdicoccus niigatensis]
MTKSATLQRRRPAPAPEPARDGHPVTALLAVLLAVVTIAAVYFFVQNQSKSAAQSRAAAGEQARRAACYYVPEIVTFDYRNLDPFFKKILDGATGEWKKDFSDTADRMRDVLTRSQMVSGAGDTECGLVESDGTTATVVVAVAQSLKTSADAAPRPAQVAMVAEMELHDGTWLCTKLNAPMFD